MSAATQKAKPTSIITTTSQVPSARPVTKSRKTEDKKSKYSEAMKLKMNEMRSHALVRGRYKQMVRDFLTFNLAEKTDS